MFVVDELDEMGVDDDADDDEDDGSDMDNEPDVAKPGMRS